MAFEKKSDRLLGHEFSTFGWGDHGLGSNYPEMLKWYRKAAEQGDAPSQRELGYCYVAGRGVEKDPVEAAKWLRKAAEQGDARAQYGLGELYSTCDAVGKNDAEAVKWFIKSAEQGDKGAQMALAKFYSSGRVVKKDMQVANYLEFIANAYEVTMWEKDGIGKHINITKEMAKKKLLPGDRAYLDSLSPEKQEKFLEGVRNGMSRHANHGELFEEDIVTPTKSPSSSDVAKATILKQDKKDE